MCLNGPGGRGEQAEGAGALDGLAAAVHAELGVQVAHVGGDGVHRQGQLAGDLLSGQVSWQVAQDVSLAGGERLY
jgi:hypothetical protein